MNQIIENIISNFNFERVHDIMAALKWEWHLSKGSSTEVPSVVKLVARATGLLLEVSEMEPDCSISMGGFKATKVYNEEQGYGIKLEFILEQTEFYERETE